MPELSLDLVSTSELAAHVAFLRAERRRIDRALRDAVRRLDARLDAAQALAAQAEPPAGGMPPEEGADAPPAP